MGEKHPRLRSLHHNAECHQHGFHVLSPCQTHGRWGRETQRQRRHGRQSGCRPEEQRVWGVMAPTSSAVHSAMLVGLERAKMMGASLKRAMSLMISSVKTLGTAAAPIRTVGPSNMSREAR